jgi:hypothetical protein
MEITEINDRLARIYGRDTVYNVPLFRVVWTSDLTEKRQGKYEDYTESGIYLGTKFGIREVPKYWYISPCFMLEKFEKTFTRGVYDEVKEPYQYESIFPFLDKNNNRLPLSWYPIEFAISTWVKMERKHRDLKAEEEAQTAAKVEKNLNLLHADDPIEQPTFKSSVYVGNPLEIKQ